ncbi:MAG: hypothetical protein JNM13_15745 [Hyphomicrobiaceae bacterium]|nr:hypothetical protein [Hyphomicrobiaceae bacterium]
MAVKRQADSAAGETPVVSAAATTTPTEPALTPAVRITTRRDGFRRCGVAHAAAPVDYPAGAWSPAELDTLRSEPELVVELVDGD